MRKEWIWIAMGAALLAAGCGDDKAPVGAVTNAAAPVTAPVAQPKQAVPAVNEPGDASLTVSGPIIVEHQVELTAQRDGVVLKIYFDAPARVKSGTLLAELDGRQIQANLAAARAKTRSIEADLKNWEAEEQVLKADYERQKNLWDLGLTSKEQLEHARYKAESDQWDIKRVTETLNTSEAPLLMRFTLPEKFFGKIHNGQEIEITCADTPEKHMAKVKEVSPVVDPSSGTFEVLVVLEGDRGSLRPGMTAAVHLENPH